MQEWRPDEQLIPAFAAGRCARTYDDLSGPDRAWVIAGLSRRDITAERIAELLDCSLRTVRVVKADAAAAVCDAYQTESDAFISETRMLRSERDRLAAELEAALRSNERLRANLVRVTAARDETGVPLCSKNQHRMTAYNTYRDRTGRVWCRECHRQRQSEHRKRKSQTRV